MTFRRYSALVLASLTTLTACADSISDPVATHQAAAPGEVAPLRAAAANGVEDSYIVVLKEGADPRAVAAIAHVDPVHVYESAVNGFAANLNKGQLTALQQNRNVAYIEPDQVVSEQGSVTQKLDNAYGDPWGIDRIDQRSLSLSRTYTYESTGAGAGVYVYVIDSGIDTGHPEFEGRAKNVFDVFGGSGYDCRGHGTHVAGTVGGKTWGVAKKAYLRGMKVLDCNGSGTLSGFIKAVDWVTKKRANPAVVNMSIISGKSSTLNTAVNNLANSGVFVAASAGNNGKNACYYSPASASAAYTVAGSNEKDYKVSSSNYGSCVDGYAPGYMIMSAYPGGKTKLYNGTSQASPHVAAIAALYKSRYGNASSSTITSWINNNATTGKIKNNPSYTPNRLVFKGSL
jgi:subtilisin family serine protease